MLFTASIDNFCFTRLFAISRHRKVQTEPLKRRNVSQHNLLVRQAQVDQIVGDAGETKLTGRV